MERCCAHGCLHRQGHGNVERRSLAAARRSRGHRGRAGEVHHLGAGCNGDAQPVSVGTVTPSFDDVQPLPPTGVAVPFWEIPTILTVTLLGFWTWTIRSAVDPGRSVEFGEPLATA